MNRLPVMTWLRLVRVFQKGEHAAVDHLRHRDLSLAQFDVLAQVGAAEGITQQELADHLLVTKGNVCQLLDRMERAGLVARRQEGRANRLYLTGTGKSLRADVLPAQEDVIARVFSPLSREEQIQLLALLSKLDRAMA
ncbi:MAG TPA: MarR family transcriptional regulator [Ktedonobacterales bacterium]